MRNLVPLRGDDGHGNRPGPPPGEEPAVVELRAVLADQPDLAAVQAAALEGELEGVARAAVGGDVEYRAGRLFGVVDVELDEPLLSDRRRR